MEFFGLLFEEDTWIAALMGLGFGFVDAAIMRVIATQLGGKWFVVLGFLQALWGFIQSMNMCYEMATQQIPRNVLAQYLAIMVAMIILSTLIIKLGRGAKKLNKFKQQSKAGKKSTASVSEIKLEGQESNPPDVKFISGEKAQQRPGETAPLTGDRKFKPVNTDEFSGIGHSEDKNLNKIAEQLPKDAKGKITMFVDRKPCFSCEGVIQQADDYFPNIELEVWWF
jgi:hypothetical protein